VEKGKNWGKFSSEVDEFLQFTKNEPQVRCSPGQTLDLSEKRATFIQCPFWDIIMPQGPAVYGAPACAGAGDEGEGIFPPF